MIERKVLEFARPNRRHRRRRRTRFDYGSLATSILCYKHIAISVASTSTKFAPTPDRRDVESEASIITVACCVRQWQAGEVDANRKFHHLGKERGRVPTANGMNPITPNPQQGRTLRQLYPHLRDSQLEEANENLRQYIALALRAFERLELDAEAWARFEALTVSWRGSRMNHEKPQTNLPNDT
jgi:hypothetical protein